MANNLGCGGSGRRINNNGYGCLGSVNRRCRWENFPYYDGPCPDAEGVYDCCDERRGDNGGRRCCRRPCFGMFTAMAPMAMAANGIIPLVNSNFCSDSALKVNSGMVSIDESGTYLATYTVRVPEGAEIDSTITLNVNDASQSSAITQVGGAAPACFTGQAIFDVCDRATVTLRSTDAINLTDPSVQPVFALSLMRLDQETE